MAAIQKKKLKQRVNISIDESLKQSSSRFAKERYNTSLSAVITTLLMDWNAIESKKKIDNVNQGSLL